MSKQDNLLFVPIRLDVLKLTEDQTVVEPSVDFSQLPYTIVTADGTHHDHNSSTAFVSEAVASQAFQNLNLTLKKGVHLHWALPDTLTTAKGNDDSTFPAVPNRWMVIKHNRKTEAQTSWLIESDYLHPSSTVSLPEHATVPLPLKDGRIDKPFRYMGRALDTSQWSLANMGDYWENHWGKPLDATGYGHPLFASFYPNCMSVFGFYDPDTSISEDIFYDIIGWYHQPDQDILPVTLANKQQQFIIYRQPFDQYFSDLGRLAWKQLTTTSGNAPQQAKVHPQLSRLAFENATPQLVDTLAVAAPKAHPLSPFLSPSPMKVFVKKSSFLKSDLLKKQLPLFQAVLRNVWPLLHHPPLAKDTAWLSPLPKTPSATIAIIDTVALLHPLQKIPTTVAPWMRFIQKMLEQDRNRLLIDKTVFQAFVGDDANFEKLWQQLIKSNWIGLINEEYAFTKNIVERTILMNPSKQSTKKISAYLLAADRPVFTSKAYLLQYFPHFLIDYLIDELQKVCPTVVELFEGKTLLKDSEKTDQWELLDPLFQDYIPTIKSCFDDPQNPRLLPKQRLIDRYGITYGKKLWLKLKQKAWISPFQQFDHLATVNTVATLSQEAQLGTFAGSIEEALTTIFGKSEAQTGLPALAYRDLLNHRILNLHGDFSQVHYEELVHYSGEAAATHWPKLEEVGLITTQALAVQTKKLTGDLTVYQAVIDQLSVKGTLTKAEVVSAFDDLAQQIWSDYFDKGWLLPEEGTIAPSKKRQVLTQSFNDQQIAIHGLVPDSIQRADFIKKYGKAEGLRVWASLWTNIFKLPASASATTAPIPDKPDTNLFANYPELQGRGTAIMGLIYPNVLHQRFIDAFGEVKGTEIWEELLAKKWVIGDTTKKGFMPSDEPWKKQSLSVKHKAEAKAYLSLKIKEANFHTITKELNWVAGIKLNTNDLSFINTGGDSDGETLLWKELMDKNWLDGEVKTKTDHYAYLQPVDNRKALSVAFSAQLPFLRHCLHKKIGEASLPTGTCFYGRTFMSETSADENGALSTAKVEVTIANNATEGLSHHLSKEIDAENFQHIENELEAIQLHRKIDQEVVDKDAMLKILRHEKGFHAQDGGKIWQLVIEDKKHSDQKISSADQPTLSVALADQLNALNQLQQEYEKALHEIEDMRTQLFMDWYKYQLSIYPPAHSPDIYPNIDVLRSFIERFDLVPLEQKIVATGYLQLNHSLGKIIGGVAYNNQSDKEQGILADASLAGELAKAISDFVATIDALNEVQLGNKPTQIYVLKQIPGPRYWTPTDPSLLLTGELMKPTLRHQQDGRFREDKRLLCHLIPHNNPNSYANISEMPISVFHDAITTLAQEASHDPHGKAISYNSPAFHEVIEQPWHALTVEWDILFSSLNKNNGATAHQSQPVDYPSNFIHDRFTMHENEPDFSPKNALPTLGTTSHYVHSSQLTGFVGPYYSKTLQDFIDRKSKAKGNGAATDSMLAHAKTALAKVEKMDAMSQSLSGLHLALQLKTQSVQLPIADPLAFSSDEDTQDYAAFAKRVRKAVGKWNSVAPDLQNVFNPIRAGRLSVAALRLVDTFGQYQDLNLNIAKPAHMADPLHDNYIKLSPRLAQAARLNFRWLSAADKQMEMNTHPATSPILGWVMQNYLDNSLYVYNQEGAQLFEIDVAGTLRAPLASSDSVATIMTSISNPTLQAFCAYLHQLSTIELTAFKANIEESLEKIQPAYFARHQDIALLMSKPLALVNIGLGVTYKGLSAVDQGWTLFERDMQQDWKAVKVPNIPPHFEADQLNEMLQKTRSTAKVEAVEFPVRIGDELKLNDGLVCYWDQLEQDNTVAPKFTVNRDNEVLLSMKKGIQYLTLLFDPTAHLHATSGILPTKRIDLPEDQYLRALKKIKVHFLSAPILTKRKQLQVPIPEETGMEWSWLGHVNNTLIKSPYITQEEFAYYFQEIAWEKNAQQLWTYLQNVDWIGGGRRESGYLSVSNPTPNTSHLNQHKIWGAQAVQIVNLIHELAAGPSASSLSLADFSRLWAQKLKQQLTQKARNYWAYLAQMGVIDAKTYEVNTNKLALQKVILLKEVAQAGIHYNLKKLLQLMAKQKQLSPDQFVRLYLRVHALDLALPSWATLAKIGCLTQPSTMLSDWERVPVAHIAWSAAKQQQVFTEMAKKEAANGASNQKIKLLDCAAILTKHVVDLRPMAQVASFHGQQELREGWLQLSPKEITKE